MATNVKPYKAKVPRLSAAAKSRPDLDISGGVHILAVDFG